MGVQFLRLDGPSRELLSKILARKAAARSRRGGASPMALGGLGRPPDRHERHRAAEDRHQRRPRRRSSASTRPACGAPSIGTGSAPGKAAGEIDELEKLLKPEPIEPVSIAQALAELPRLLDPARHRRMSGAFRAVGGDKPEDR